MDDKKVFITTSIPYANATPHVGHILDPLIADVLARYHRLKGGEVRFLAGTDEHGVKILRTAEAQGKTPQELVDENSAKFREMHKALNIVWDDFIRTSDRNRHWPGAEEMWRRLAAAGDVYRKKYRGWYCVGHEAFVTEKDLVDGKCQDHQTEPEVIEEENWFFRLSKYSKEIGLRITQESLCVIPEGKKNEILSLIRSGLEDVSVSRPRQTVSWGVPVPEDPAQTMYVWLEALTCYISSIGYGRADQESLVLFQKWWPADVQVIGKDNLRFHAAIWPGMLLSAGLPLPHTIFVHGFITVEGQKISKTVGNVIDPREIVQKYGTDPVRYYFLRGFSPSEDGDFSYRKLEERYNGELANGLGNLVARVATLGEKVSSLQFDFGRDLLPNIREATAAAFANYERAFAEFRLNEAIAEVWRLIGFTDRYLNAASPWALSDTAEFRKIIINAAYLVSTVSNLLRPFLPETAGKIQEQVRFRDSVIEIKRGAVLFPRL